MDWNNLKFLIPLGIYFSIHFIFKCIIKYYPSVRLFISDIFNVFGFFGKWFRKRNLESRLTGTIDSLSKNFNSDMYETMLPYCKIKWIDSKVEESYFQNGKAIICISFKKNRNLNIFNAAYSFVKVTILRHTKVFLNENTSDAIDLLTLKLLLEKTSREVMSIFNGNFKDSNTICQDMYFKLNEIKKEGLFKRILLPELLYWGELIRLETPNQILEKESNNFIQWLYEDAIIDLREDEGFKFIFESANIKTVIILVASSETYDKHGIDPYLRRANRYATNDFHVFYLWALGSIKGDIAQDISKELINTNCFTKLTRRDYFYIYKEGKKIKVTCIALRPEPTSVIQLAWGKLNELEREKKFFKVFIEEVREKYILVDAYGLKIQIDNKDLSEFEIKNSTRYFHRDQEIIVKVKEINQTNEYIRLSNKGSETDPAILIKQIKESNPETIKVRIEKVISHEGIETGLIVGFRESDLQGYIPRRLATKFIYQPLSEIYPIGKEIIINLIEFNKEYGRFTCSIPNLNDPWDNFEYKIGDIVEVTIREIREKLIKCELDCGAVGILPSSQISWHNFETNLEKINSFKIKSKIKVRIIEYNTVNKKMILSIKETIPNPNIIFYEEFKNKSVNVIVEEIRFSGARVILPNSYYAFLPLREISYDYIEDINDYLSIEDNICVKVISYHEIYENIVVSLKQAKS